MGKHHHDQQVPRAVLLGAGALILATIGLSAEARLSSSSAEDPIEAAALQQSIDLRFEDRPDGSVVVLEAVTSRQVDVVPPAEGGFVRGVMRGMFRTRMLESIPHEGHFRLMRLVDGSLVIEDPQSGRRVDLGGFGDTNRQAFERMFEDGRAG